MGAKSMTYNGQRFHLVAKTKLKSNAQKRAKGIRRRGFTARIDRIGALHGVFIGPRRKR